MIKCTGACHDIYRILGLSILCCQSRLIIWSNTQALVTIFATALNASPITPNEVALRKIAVSEVWQSGPQIVLKIWSRYCFDFNCWPLPKKPPGQCWTSLRRSQVRRPSTSAGHFPSYNHMIPFSNFFCLLQETRGIIIWDGDRLPWHNIMKKK